MHLCKVGPNKSTTYTATQLYCAVVWCWCSVDNAKPLIQTHGACKASPSLLQTHWCVWSLILSLTNTRNRPVPSRMANCNIQCGLLLTGISSLVSPSQYHCMPYISSDFPHCEWTFIGPVGKCIQLKGWLTRWMGIELYKSQCPLLALSEQNGDLLATVRQ